MSEREQSGQPNPEIPPLPELVERAYQRFLSQERWEPLEDPYHTIGVSIDICRDLGVASHDLVAAFLRQSQVQPADLADEFFYANLMEARTWDEICSLIATTILETELIRAHPDVEEIERIRLENS